jgi:hypothetical protein
VTEPRAAEIVVAVTEPPRPIGRAGLGRAPATVAAAATPWAAFRPDARQALHPHEAR